MTENQECQLIGSLVVCGQRAGNDIGSLAQRFKKSYIDERYSVEEAEKKYAEWDGLMQRLFVRRK
jgi:hypothetical protein